MAEKEKRKTIRPLSMAEKEKRKTIRPLSMAEKEKRKTIRPLSMAEKEKRKTIRLRLKRLLSHRLDFTRGWYISKIRVRFPCSLILIHTVRKSLYFQSWDVKELSQTVKKKPHLISCYGTLRINTSKCLEQSFTNNKVFLDDIDSGKILKKDIYRNKTFFHLAKKKKPFWKAIYGPS